MTSAAWPAEIRERAIEMIESGRAVQEISRELRVPVHTIYKWRYQFHFSRMQASARAARKSSKKGSGVIAPAPYARGLIFPGGSGRGRGE